ncbi:MAG: polysaccharide biosynthesis/export family protein [Candidatus Riflebacteria bacterium]|nr:polysaccharide biosynthesis/export family protein [Candidatus Riflebacteria bacterium]
MKKIKWLLFIGIAYFWASGVVFSASPALLKPGDVLTVSVKGEPELSCDRIIAPDGSITMPLIGSIGVAGMKTTDAAQLIKQQLEDGFLKNPVVSVSTSKSFSSDNNAKKQAKSSIPMTEEDMTYAVVDDNPLGSSLYNESTDSESVSAPVTSEEQILIEIRDVVTDKGISDAVLNIDNKIYQTNRLGQILVNAVSGRAIVIADGYKTATGSLNAMLKQGKAGNPSYITLEKIRLNENMLCTVVDAKNHKPIRNAEVLLEGGKVTTNSRGEFKISGIKKEFGEVVIKKRGYAVLKRVIDYKGPAIITFELTK